MKMKEEEKQSHEERKYENHTLLVPSLLLWIEMLQQLPTWSRQILGFSTKNQDTVAFWK